MKNSLIAPLLKAVQKIKSRKGTSAQHALINSKSAYLLFFFLISGTIVFAQNLFEKKYDFGSFEQAMNIQQAYDSGYFILGSTKGNSGPFDFDVLYLRTDKKGDTLWSKRLVNPSYDLPASSVQTADSGLAIIVDTDISGSDDIWLIKTNAAGDTVWTKFYGAAGNLEIPFGIAQTGDNGFIISAIVQDINKGMEFSLLKTNSSGDTLWTKKYGGNLDEGYLVNKVALTYDGGYAVLGTTMSFGSGGKDFYLLKTNSNGDSLWSATFGTSGDDIPFYMEQTADSGFVLLGKFEMPLDSNNLTLLRTDKDGNLLWLKHPGREHLDMGNHLHINTDGSMMITGYANTAASQRQVMLMKTDASGDTLWLKTFGGEFDDDGIAICKTKDNGFALTGNTEGFGFITDDVYLVKTDSDGNVACPQLSFAMSDTVFCGSKTVNFYNTTAGTSQYSWYADDTLFSDAISPSYFFQYPGNHVVKLKSCTDSATASVIAYQPPPADFNFSVSDDSLSFLFMPPGNLQSLLWDFGDGNMDSLNVNPVHVYTAVGLYPVSLTINDTNGCSGTEIKQVSIYPVGMKDRSLVSNYWSVDVYPNPFREKAVMQITNTYEFTNYNLRITIYNLVGREVLQLNNLISNHPIIMSRNGLPDGIYFYQVTGDNKMGTKEIIATGKLVIQ